MGAQNMVQLSLKIRGHDCHEGNGWLWAEEVHLYERVGVKEYCAIGPTIDAGQSRITKRVILAGAFAETGIHLCM